MILVPLQRWMILEKRGKVRGRKEKTHEKVELRTRSGAQQPVAAATMARQIFFEGVSAQQSSEGPMETQPQLEEV